MIDFKKVLSAIALSTATTLAFTVCGSAHQGQLTPTAARGIEERQVANMASSLNLLAFTNRPRGTDHIYTINTNGSNLRQLTNSTTSESGPIAWSKDGKQIAFSRGGNIFRLNADLTDKKQLTTSGMDFMPDWSPDGTKVVFLHVSNPGPLPITYLRTINSADGSGQTQLLGDGKSFFAAPHYSPDGNKLLFESTLNTPGTFEIYTCSMSSCSTTVNQLTNLYPGAVADPAWSFDGSRISISMADAMTGANVNVGVMNADGSNLTQLTHFIEPIEAQDPSISPDGKYIAFEWDNCTGLSNCQGGTNNSAPAVVYTMNIDGTNQLSTGRACSAVGCSPRYRPTPTSALTLGTTAALGN